MNDEEAAAVLIALGDTLRWSGRHNRYYGEDINYSYHVVRRGGPFQRWEYDSHWKHRRSKRDPLPMLIGYAKTMEEARQRCAEHAAGTPRQLNPWGRCCSNLYHELFLWQYRFNLEVIQRRIADRKP